MGRTNKQKPPKTFLGFYQGRRELKKAGEYGKTKKSRINNQVKVQESLCTFLFQLPVFIV
jgi:hypothetical protein